MYPTNLPAEVLIVGVSHVEGLGGESIGLDFHVGPSNTIHKGRFSDIGETERTVEGLVREALFMIDFFLLVLLVTTEVHCR